MWLYRKNEVLWFSTYVGVNERSHRHRHRHRHRPLSLGDTYRVVLSDASFKLHHIASHGVGHLRFSECSDPCRVESSVRHSLIGSRYELWKAASEC